MQNYLESRMLGNLHVRFGVGAGVKSPGLHHFILACGGQSYARLRYNVGPGVELELPVGVDYSRPFPGCDIDAWEEEYLANVQPQPIARTTPPARELGFTSPSPEEPGEAWYQDWFDYAGNEDLDDDQLAKEIAT